MEKRTIKKPMRHYNIAEFNRGQSSKILRGLVSEDDVGFINKNGKPMAILISYERYERLLKMGIDLTEY